MSDASSSSNLVPHTAQEIANDLRAIGKGGEGYELSPAQFRTIERAADALEALSLPDETRDDARDAARYRYLRERLACDRLAARKLVITTEGGREPYRTLREAELDREIDECIGLSVEPAGARGY